MKHKTIALLLVVVLAGFVAGNLSAEKAAKPKPKIHRENTEWVQIWCESSNDTKRPRVLLVGDSICVGYFPQTSKLLRGVANCSKLATSASCGDPMLLDQIASLVKNNTYDVIHFNNGLHGMGYSEAEYKAGLVELVAMLKKLQPQAKLIWRSSTPVHKKREIKGCSNARIIARNTIALEVIAGQGIAVDDFHARVCKQMNLIGGDGIHYGGKGKALQAGWAANAVKKALGTKTQKES